MVVHILEKVPDMMVSQQSMVTMVTMGGDLAGVATVCTLYATLTKVENNSGK
jgi:hypothetical protein